MMVFLYTIQSMNWCRHLKFLRCRKFKWWVHSISAPGFCCISVNFRPWRFFCWSLKKNCRDNIEITLGKTFRLKCDINFFEITLPPHRSLLGNLSFVFGGCSWYSFIVIMIFTLFIIINLRSILPGDVLEKMYSLYIRKTPRKTNVLSFFPLSFEIFLFAHAQ